MFTKWVQVLHKLKSSSVVDFGYSCPCQMQAQKKFCKTLEVFCYVKYGSLKKLENGCKFTKWVQVLHKLKSPSVMDFGFFCPGQMEAKKKVV